MTPAITSFDGEYRWLSNFWPARIELGGRIVSTLEHAYQASKAAFEEDFERIAALETPGKAKRAGQKLKKQGKMRPDWLDVRTDIMAYLLRLKFEEGSELWWKLANTEDAEIIEGNTWHDIFWGVCTCDKCPTGENVLGKLLMELRAEIQQKIWDATVEAHEEWDRGGGFD